MQLGYVTRLFLVGKGWTKAILFAKILQHVMFCYLLYLESTYCLVASALYFGVSSGYDSVKLFQCNKDRYTLSLHQYLVHENLLTLRKQMHLCGTEMVFRHNLSNV